MEAALSNSKRRSRISKNRLTIWRGRTRRSKTSSTKSPRLSPRKRSRKKRRTRTRTDPSGGRAALA
jgi:hypothetical protein